MDNAVRKTTSQLITQLLTYS